MLDSVSGSDTCILIIEENIIFIFVKEERSLIANNNLLDDVQVKLKSLHFFKHMVVEMVSSSSLQLSLQVNKASIYKRNCA